MVRHIDPSEGGELLNRFLLTIDRVTQGRVQGKAFGSKRDRRRDKNLQRQAAEAPVRLG
jgi:hypothetical protein